MCIRDRNNRDNFSDAIFGNWVWNPATTEEAGYYTGRYGDKERHFSPYAVAQIEGIAGGDTSKHEDFVTAIAEREGEDPDKKRKDAPITGEITEKMIIGGEDQDAVKELNNWFKGVTVGDYTFDERYEWKERGGMDWMWDNDVIVLYDRFTGDPVYMPGEGSGQGDDEYIVFQVGRDLAAAGSDPIYSTLLEMNNLKILKPYIKAKKLQLEDERIEEEVVSTGGVNMG